MAPVIMVGDKIHGDVTPDKVPALLEHYTNLARQETRPDRDEEPDDQL
jgi:hypothetical protein